MGGNYIIDLIKDIFWGAHFCQFYQTEKDLLDIVVPYFKAGLENSELCIWITPEFLNIEETKKVLNEFVPDFDFYLERQQIELIPYTDLHSKKGIFETQGILGNLIEKINEAYTRGYTGLRVSNEICSLEKNSLEEIIDYEGRINSITDKHPIRVLCTYPLEMYSSIDIIEIAGNHDFALGKRNGEWKKIESYRRKKTEDLKQTDGRAKELSQGSLAAKSHFETLLKYLPVEVIVAEATSRKLLIGNEYVKKIFRDNLPPPAGIEEYGEYTCFHPNGRQYTEEELPLARAIQKGEEIIGEEIEFQLVDGTRRIVSVSAAPIRDEEGQIISGVVVSEDITERKRLEETLKKAYFELEEKVKERTAELQKAYNLLKENEERYRSLYESSLDGILLTKPDGTILSANPQACQLFGMNEDEMIQAGREGLVVKDEKLTSAHKERELAGQSKAELTLKRKDGSIFIGEISSSLFKDSYGNKKTSLIIRDITQRKLEEHRTQRYNKVLRAINRIFGSVVKAETEEELGNSCLSVALEVTESQFGFVGEIGADGLLNDIEISMWWERCKIYNKTGHHPGNFVLHGLYGSIIDKGKSVFINDPSSHSDITGIPQDHPQFTSFLGVPLILDEKIMGILAVANRENGYSMEQQEDLEAIAPSIAKALQRKYEEQQLKLAEEELREKEAELTEAQQLAHIGNWYWDAQKDITAMSDEGLRIFGFDLTTQIMPEFKEQRGCCYPVEDWERLNAVMQKTLETGDAYELDLHAFRNTVPIWVTIRSAVVRDADNQIVGLRGTVQDITERKNIAEALKASESHLRAFVTASSEIIYRMSPDWKEMNKLCGRGFLSDTEKSNGYWLEEYILPEDQPHVTVIINEAIRKKSIFELEHRVRKADGNVGWVYSRAIPFLDKNREIIEWFGASCDITSRKLAEEALRGSEERYRTFFNNSAVGTVEIDCKGQLINFNDLYCQITGYSREELLGMNVAELLYPDDRDYNCKQLADYFSEGDSKFSAEKRYVRKDGRVIWVQVTASIVHDIEGKPLRSAGIVQDITEKKTAEEVHAKYEAARQKEIHHRVKNNLQVIFSLLDLEAEKFSNKKFVQNTEVIQAFKESQNRVMSIAFIHKELHESGKLDTLDFPLYVEKLTKNLFQTYSVGNRRISLNLELEKNIFFDIDIAIP
ncbi:MAG: PAS domain S-box protein, partial [Methanosarcina sp.]